MLSFNKPLLLLGGGGYTIRYDFNQLAKVHFFILETWPAAGHTKLPLHLDARLQMIYRTMTTLSILDLISNFILRQRKCL